MPPIPHHLAPTLQPLGDPKPALNRLSALGIRAVQLSATQPGLRPRELNQSARRDLRATLRRRELTLTGLDCWIPPAHFLDPHHADRAIATLLATIELAADLHRCPVSITLPIPVIPAQEGIQKQNQEENRNNQFITTLTNHAQHHGITLANHTLPFPKNTQNKELSIGLDTAAALAAGEDPTALLHTPNLAVIHLSDLHTTGLRGPLGQNPENQLDLSAFAATLSIIQPPPSLVLDLRQWSHPWPGLTQSLATWAAATP